jgi:hypothetical protein
MVKVLMRWMAVVLWMGVIFALSATPSLASPFEPIYDFILRKMAHVTVYAVLTILVYGALRPHMARPTHAWLLAMLMATLYACSDAWHQTFVPGREGHSRCRHRWARGYGGIYAGAPHARQEGVTSLTSGGSPRIGEAPRFGSHTRWEYISDPWRAGEHLAAGQRGDPGQPPDCGEGGNRDHGTRGPRPTTSAALSLYFD